MKAKSVLTIFLALYFLFPPVLSACTTFCLNTGKRIVFGRNYDWSIGDGLVVINKRNTEKSISAIGNRVILRWVSKYGSISFNQYGVDSPMDGLNEAGLVVAQMWLDGTGYPVADSRPGVGALTWIQYQLNCESPIQVMDINSAWTGKVRERFRDYTTAINRDLIFATYKHTSFLQNIPDHTLNRIAEYPESFRCIK